MKTIKHTVGKKAYKVPATAAHISQKSGNAIKDIQIISVKTGIAEGSPMPSTRISTNG